MQEAPIDLSRFVEAQSSVYEEVREELRQGRKTSHWMWFIFPQLAGLGSSAMAQRYAIASLAEATAYHQHALLGARLRECTELVNRIEGASIAGIFGHPDDMKFRSSMTLFVHAAPAADIYRKALAKYFAGAEDQRTLELLRQ